MSLYLNDNCLVVNAPKTQLTECMIGQKRGKVTGVPPTVTVEKTPGIFKTIQNSEYMRILGANVSGNLLWHHHLESGVKALLPAARRQLGLLRHLGNKLPMRTRNNLAKGLILSRLNYLMPLWGGAPDTLINKVQVLLNTTARWVSGKGRRTRVSKLMEVVGWFSIREQIYISTALQTWKIVHWQRPLRMRDRWTISQDRTITLPGPRLHFSQGCYRWRAALLWNQLSPELREEVSISNFKRMIKRHVLDGRDMDPGE